MNIQKSQWFNTHESFQEDSDHPVIKTYSDKKPPLFTAGKIERPLS